MQYKIMGEPKKFKNGPVLYLGLKLTIHVIESQIHLVRQSLNKLACSYDDTHLVCLGRVLCFLSASSWPVS